MTIPTNRGGLKDEMSRAHQKKSMMPLEVPAISVWNAAPKKGPATWHNTGNNT